MHVSSEYSNNMTSISGTPIDHIDQSLQINNLHMSKTIIISKKSLYFSKFKVITDFLLLIVQFVAMCYFTKINVLSIFLIMIHFFLSFIIMILNISRLVRDIHYVRESVRLEPFEYHNLLCFNKHPYDAIKLVNLCRPTLELIMVSFYKNIFNTNGLIIFGSMFLFYLLMIFVQVFVSKNKEKFNVDTNVQRNNQLRATLLRSFLEENMPIIITEQILKTFGLNLECSICLDELCEGDVIRTLECSHNFHQSCIDRWLKNKTVCPMCRHELISDI